MREGADEDGKACEAGEGGAGGGEGKCEKEKGGDGSGGGGRLDALSGSGPARLELMMKSLQVAETREGSGKRRSFERQLRHDNKLLGTATGTAWLGGSDGDGDGDGDGSSSSDWESDGDGDGDSSDGLFGFFGGGAGAVVAPVLPAASAQAMQRYGPKTVLSLWTVLVLAMLGVPQLEWLRGERGVKVGGWVCAGVSRACRCLSVCLLPPRRSVAFRRTHTRSLIPFPCFRLPVFPSSHLPHFPSVPLSLSARRPCPARFTASARTASSAPSSCSSAS